MSDDLVRLARRVMHVVGRVKLALVDDSQVVQFAQVNRGPSGTSIKDKTPIMGLFGLSSNPPSGSDAVILSIGGDFSSTVAIATNHQSYRPKGLQPGDVCLYDMRSGQTITLTAAGVSMTDQWGNSIVMAEGQMTLTHSAKIVLAAPEIDLAGAGGARVARLGDQVTVGGSTGTITGASTKVKAN